MCIEKASRKTVTTDFKVTLSQRGELFQETIKLFRPKIGHIANNRPKGEKKVEKLVVPEKKFRQKSPHRQVFFAYRQDPLLIAKFRPLFWSIARNFCS